MNAARPGCRNRAPAKLKFYIFLFAPKQLKRVRLCRRGHAFKERPGSWASLFADEFNVFLRSPPATFDRDSSNKWARRPITI